IVPQRKRKPAPSAPSAQAAAAQGTRSGWLGWLVAGVLAMLGAAVAGWRVLGPTAPSGPNLLLITIDTLRADRVGAYGAPTGATPVLDALAGRGVRFDEAQTAVPLTGPSHAT